LKTIFKRITIFIIVVASLYGVGRVGVVTYDSYLFVDRQPYMVMQTQNSITIKWQTPKEEIGKINYSLVSGTLENSLHEKRATKKHSLTISNLHECVKYKYNVESKSLKIDNIGRGFKTLCKKEIAQRLWVIGDSGERGNGQEGVYKQMLKYINHDFNKLNMWILLGDNAYRSGTQKQFNKDLFEPYKEVVKRFVPWAVTGNHDARRWAFYDIWDFPKNAQSGGIASGTDEYYSIENGNLHIVMLDNEHPSLSKDGDMAKWLRKDLAHNKKPWVIVAFHTPPYSDGSHKSDSDYNSGGRMKQMRENFVPIFDEFGVDLVLSGHSHGYERSKLIVNHLGKSDSFDVTKNVLQDNKSCYTKPFKKTKNSGTIYLVIGSSSKLDHATLKHPAMPYSFEKMGSVILEITPTLLSSKFLTIDGEIADEFVIKKITHLVRAKSNE